MNPMTIEISEDLRGWLRDQAAKLGMTEEDLIIAELQKAHSEYLENPWAKYAGIVKGLPQDLSTREGFGSR